MALVYGRGLSCTELSTKLSDLCVDLAIACVNYFKRGHTPEQSAEHRKLLVLKWQQITGVLADCNFLLRDSTGERSRFTPLISFLS